MVDFHVNRNAIATVAAIPVPIEDARQFGVIQVDEDWRIVGFQEKPENPAPLPNDKNMALASMGNYIFGGIMRKRNEGNFAVIREFVDRYFLENQRSPSTREIEAGTGIPRATAQRCLRLMSESGEISYGKRRGIETDLSRKIGDSVSVTLYESTVSCGAPSRMQISAR